MILRSTRRTFIQATLAGLLSWIYRGILHRPPSAQAFQPRDQIKGLRGQVVLFRNPSMTEALARHRLELIQSWMARAMEQLTGQKGPDAWRVLFHPEDKVAIKVNALGGPGIATSPQVAMAIALELQRAGVRPKHILIWDRSTRELQKADYPIRESGEGPFCFGTDRLGYEALPRLRGAIGSCFSPIITRWATALVDIPVMKDHDLSGVSLSIKNLYGVIHNPNKYHDSGCTPYLVDLLECAEVQETLRLAVCDAHQGQCQGGPAFVQKWTWPYNGLLVGVDPVAVDRTGADILEARRRELGLPSLEEAGRKPIHIEMAHSRGLGEGSTQAIRKHELIE